MAAARSGCCDARLPRRRRSPPSPSGLHGRGLLVAARPSSSPSAVLVDVAAAARAAEQGAWPPASWRAAVSFALIALQPKGLWVRHAVPGRVVAAMRLPRRAGTVVFVADLAATVAVASLAGHATRRSSVVLIGVDPVVLVHAADAPHARGSTRTKGLVERAARVARGAGAGRRRGRALAARARDARRARPLALGAGPAARERRGCSPHDRGADPEVDARDRARARPGRRRPRGGAARDRRAARRGAARARSACPALVEAARAARVDFDVSGEPRELAPDARLALYRTAQEALTNVRRHATPDRVELRLAYRDDATVLAVADHGAARRAAARERRAATG